jgi:hypothetical protein
LRSKIVYLFYIMAPSSRPGPDCSGWCSVWCVSRNVDGFTSPSPNSAISWSHGLERFAAVTVELSVQTGKSLQPRTLARAVKKLQ